MASHMSITEPQAKALNKFIEAKLPETIDELVQEMGQEDAFRIYAVHQRLPKEETEEGS